jgi:hypothetical protein
MSYLGRRFLGPLALIAVSFGGLLLLLRSTLPHAVPHAAITGANAAGTSAQAAVTSARDATRQGTSTLGSGLTWLTDAVFLGLHLAVYTACALLVSAVPVAVIRLRARRQRAEPGRMLCAELRLGRDDHASPYEVSKVFDGIAGALRPHLVGRVLAGPETLVLKIANDPDAKTVRFFVCATAGFHAPIAARLAATYPDVKLSPLDTSESDPLGLAGIPSPFQALNARLRGEPTAPLGVEVLRLKKARRWLWALATTKDYEHAPIESLVSVMHATRVRCVAELVLTPAPVLLDRYAGRALRGRERSLKLEGGFSPQEPGVQSVVAQKHLKGALEGVGRALWWFDYRVLVPAGSQAAGRHIAGVVQETRAENYLRVRVMRVRRGLYAWRSARGLPPLFPALWSGVLSSAELASLWHLPTLRAKGVPLTRASARQVLAPSRISRDPEHAILFDEHGPLGIRPADASAGLMFLGAPNAGKTAALARRVHAVARDPSRALLIVDPKEDFARLSLSLIPAGRIVYYLDLGAPRFGLNILTAGRLSPEIRADILIAVIRELAGESAVGPRSDLFLRAAIQAVATVEPTATLQHVAALLDPYDDGYREWVVRELQHHHEVDFVRDYWQRTFPRMAQQNPRFIAEAVAAPQNKIARFLTAPSLNLLMTHPIQLDLEAIIQRREVLIVNASKGSVGEDNANLFCAMFVLLCQKLLHQQQRKPAGERASATLAIDEAHNVFMASFATMLSEGRSGGIEVAAAFQYTGQIVDERVRAGVKSLLQNFSIFRLREFEDARAAAALAMEVFSDNLRADIEDQRRVRIDPMDIVRQPNHRAVNLWLADGVPQPAFTADTRPTEELSETPEALRAREHHQGEQQRRGDHPHDHGRYIQPPLVWSVHTPVIARFRTVHIDLAAWPGRPPIEQVERVAALLKSHGGDSIAHIALPSDASRRRFTAVLPDTKGEPGWLPEGRYTIQVLAWMTGQEEPRTWRPTVQDDDGKEFALQIELADEPRRPEQPGVRTGESTQPPQADLRTTQARPDHSDLPEAA